MAGIGERMSGANDLVFDADGYPVDAGYGLPDDETLERLRVQGERWRKRVPQKVGARLDRPLHYRRRPEADEPAS